ncbi:organic hydroperoxide resistance protein [Neobacillus cucumis]|uniref:organic hydroperoxide resistance protein n=1 Tax=Neobacillus cucumis TaxID=1740721 RepID=UPI0018DFAA57|nr:organic hydroperoxide resistance protein [Neobacillus cucumis]MBI0580090.1 organic hydroperoxide resistance protein [Neobacillus cucumis]
MELLYTASATAEGGRAGKVTSSDGTLNLTLSMPKSLGGQGKENATNPEQLFAAGYAACFDSALNLVARQARKRIESKVTADVSLGKGQDGGFKLAAVLNVSIKGVSLAEAEELVDNAHSVCPYSKATNGNMDVKLITNVF